MTLKSTTKTVICSKFSTKYAFIRSISNPSPNDIRRATVLAASSLFHRQGEKERGVLSQDAFCADAPSMPVDDFLAQCEPYTCPLIGNITGNVGLLAALSMKNVSSVAFSRRHFAHLYHVPLPKTTCAEKSGLSDTPTLRKGEVRLGLN
jgi:hypothetical protein